LFTIKKKLSLRAHGLSIEASNTKKKLKKSNKSKIEAKGLWGIPSWATLQQPPKPDKENSDVKKWWSADACWTFSPKANDWSRKHISELRREAILEWSWFWLLFLKQHCHPAWTRKAEEEDIDAWAREK